MAYGHFSPRGINAADKSLRTESGLFHFLRANRTYRPAVSEGGNPARVAEFQLDAACGTKSHFSLTVSRADPSTGQTKSEPDPVTVNVRRQEGQRMT